MGEIKKQTLSGVKWTAIQKFSIQGVQFILSIFIARMLTPADYGLVGMLAIFFAISQTFIDSGMATALIRKKDANQADFSTVFYFNIIVSSFFAIAIILCSTYIADFFKEPILSPMAKLSSLNLIIGAFGAIQSTQLTIQLNFKKPAKINFIAALISGLLCLGMAYIGYGVWALVWQSILANLIRVILLWVTSKWHPSLIFSINSFKNLFGFGSKLLGASLINTIYGQASTILIGKFYTPVDLGDFSRGKSLAALPTGIVSSIFETVTFPILSKIQDDKERLINVYSRYINLIMMLSSFLVFIMASLAKPIILLLLTSKWIGAVIFLQIYAFAVLVDPACLINCNLLKVLGRSDLLMKLEFIKKGIALALLFAAVPFGVEMMCWSSVIYGQFALFLNTYYNGKLLGLSYKKQVMGFLPYVIYSAISCGPAYLLSLFCQYNIISIILGGLLAIFIFLMILKIKNDTLYAEYIKPIVTKIPICR